MRKLQELTKITTHETCSLLQARILFTSFLLLSSICCLGQLSQGDTAMGMPVRRLVSINTPAPSTAQTGKKMFEDDGSYERFMDTLISRKDVIFSAKPITATEDYYFDKIDGPTPRKPAAIIINGVKFLRSNMQIVNGSEIL
ncbi:MAG TPA: hypothetical protein VN721_17135, partial [Flavipsychrobacter sp.]|nr:hypothetical protein [Flavipsychrobacter sp.]